MEDETPPDLLVLEVSAVAGDWQKVMETLQYLNPDGRLILLKAKKDE